MSQLITALRTWLGRSPIIGAALLLAATASACSSGGGSSDVPTTGSISATGIFSASGSPRCTGTTTFTYTLVTPSPGSDGEVGPIVHTVNTDQFPSSNECHSNDLATFLHFGEWQVSWSGSPSSCLLDIEQMKWVIMRTNGNCQTRF
jgi:hypothetical protein